MTKEAGVIENIEHQGVVESVDVHRGVVRVRLATPRDCDGCAAAKICGSALGGDTTVLEIESKIAGVYSPGEKVVVSGTETMHRKALMLATVLPCIILIAVMVLVYLLTASQGRACVAGLLAMTAFFVLLWTMRGRIAREFVFTIKKEPQSSDN